MTATFDCADFVDLHKIPDSSSWVARPSRLTPSLYICGLELRAGTLRTKSRQQFGRAQLDKLCRRGCEQTETMHHIPHKCREAHAARCVRQNRGAKNIAVSQRRKGYQVFVERVIRNGTFFCKPDISDFQDGIGFVIDVEVISGHRLHESWDLKTPRCDADAVNSAII
ncbi:hypothetical protein FGIG_05087 [Fasciola gigantica]|uniref:Uncharacterized protein n=1 Tax=Fasciola gigantica TaxID=46835 RepID=A0A504YD78_FASGI|nr:hypothetical protein FGIG_05087 [Fasciola gigantica]